MGVREVQGVRYVGTNLHVVDGGLAIDYWVWLDIPRTEHPNFLAGSLRAAGFQRPWDVDLVKNGQDGRPDWQALRISRAECVRHGVDPAKALTGIKHYLESEMIRRNYGIVFECYLP